MKKYAISDIHGHLKTFESLLKTIGYDAQNDELYILGDMVDRGLESRGVLDRLMEMQASGQKVFCLRGNHEQMMLDAIDDPSLQVFWLKHGGAATRRNFIKEEGGELDVPEKYVSFLRDLPYFFDVDDYLLVHAGFNFYKKEPFCDIDAMIWIRNWYREINYKFLEDRIIIHGHTPQGQEAITAQLNNLKKGQVLDIDNGCCFPDEGMNQLCAFNMTDQELVFVPNIG